MESDVTEQVGTHNGVLVEIPKRVKKRVNDDAVDKHRHLEVTELRWQGWFTGRMVDGVVTGGG